MVSNSFVYPAAYVILNPWDLRALKVMQIPSHLHLIAPVVPLLHKEGGPDCHQNPVDRDVAVRLAVSLGVI